MRLTDKQVTHFEVFGFLILRQAFTREEMDGIITRFSEVLAHDRNGREFEGDRRQEVLGFLEEQNDLFTLVEDDRIYNPIEQLLGPGFVWIGSDGNLYVGNTRWHPDSPKAYRRVKVAFYLDPVTRWSGCLRVIPGSHHRSLANTLRGRLPLEDPAQSPYGVAGSEIPSQSLESMPGDVVIFNQSLFHASYGGRTGRRMFTLNFGAKPKGPADYDNIRQCYEANLARSRAGGDDTVRRYTARDRIYTDAFLESESPRIQKMVAQVRAMGLR